MLYTYIKKVDIPIITKEFISAKCDFIQNIETSGNIVNITTTRNINSEEYEVFYNVINSHNAPSYQEQVTKQRVLAAVQFGQQFIIEIATENIVSRFTVDQISRMLSKYGHIMTMLQSGSLYTALTAMEAIEPDDLVSLERKNRYIKKIKDFLGL